MPSARVKLTPARVEILRLLANGWQAGRSDGHAYQIEWMQQGGIGKGGARKEIRKGTLRTLREMGLLDENPGHCSHLKVFDLTDMGKAELKERCNG